MAHKFSCINSVLQDYFSGKGNVNDSSDTHGHTVLEKEPSEFISIKVKLVLFTQKTIKLKLDSGTGDVTVSPCPRI